jgi:ketosteroid isomerase-like protein
VLIVGDLNGCRLMVLRNQAVVARQRLPNGFALLTDQMMWFHTSDAGGSWSSRPFGDAVRKVLPDTGKNEDLLAGPAVMTDDSWDIVVAVHAEGNLVRRALLRTPDAGATFSRVADLPTTGLVWLAGNK